MSKIKYPTCAACGRTVGNEYCGQCVTEARILLDGIRDRRLDKASFIMPITVAKMVEQANPNNCDCSLPSVVRSLAKSHEMLRLQNANLIAQAAEAKTLMDDMATVIALTACNMFEWHGEGQIEDRLDALKRLSATE